MASAVIGALRVNLSIDTAQFEEGLKGVRASMDRAGRQLQNWGAKVSTYVSAPLSLAGAAVTAAVTTMARDVENLEKSAQISNVDVEEFQRLAHAARTVGIESDKLADIYKDMNDRVGDFMQTGGGPMADFFENVAPKVGVAAEDFAKLSGPDALQLFYDSLEKANLSQADMVFYLEAMASDATALAPLLRDGGAAARELGEGAAVLSQEDIDGLSRYNDAMRSLGEAFKAVAIALADSGAIDALANLAESAAELVRKLSETNPEIIEWGAIVGGIGAAIGPALIGVGLLVTALGTLSLPILAVSGAVASLAAAWVFWDEIRATFPATAAAIESVINLIAQNFLLLIENVGLFVQYFSQVFTGDFRAAGETVKQIASNVAEMIANVFRALPSQMLQLGKDIMQGLWDGIQGMAGTVVEGAKNIGSNIINGMKGIFQSRSPSRVMMGLGHDVMSGLGIGMSNMAGDVENIASGIASTVSQAFRGLIDGSKTVKDVITDLLGKLSEMFINQGFQALLGGGLGGGGGSGLFGGLFGGIGKLFGFANGGSFQVGGAGGIDSQLVAFKASPNERVTVTKPGQEGGRGGSMDVRVFVDDNGNWDAKVERIADRRAAAATQAGLARYDSSLNNTLASRMNKAQARQG